MSKGSEISKRAWLLREEKGEAERAMALWWGLYAGYTLEENWPEAINSLIDISIAYRGAAGKEPQYADYALRTIKLAKQISEKYSVPLREDFDYQMGKTQIITQDYKGAVDSFEAYLKKVETSTENQSNVTAQIGFAKAMIGNKDEGIRMLRESIEALGNSTAKNVHQGKDVIAIWKLGAMMKLARVLDDRAEAKKLVRDALKEAKEKNLGARGKQAQGLFDELI